ncbi:rhomboid family intramembrane serine protease [Defluviimonas sp. WL0024]|uniref:Rhomboid family intramembrane serine protease n=1 Tax=Albidovulum salinarum TaxID=2984153 RepID=A0ABT2X8I6_9RHOB|nr:rhomboid family intramembrane serine protease [Defluviimonas sp. WL0024]MCU9850054.1 rhomboid family intramembrane serine protease [Defluviimonas sp. WL0024]
MFPIRDHNPSRRTPYVVYGLIAANIVAFLLQLPHMNSERAMMVFWRDWAMIPAAVTEGGEVRGVLTSMFLHAGLMHLAGNMLFLWIFGDNLEDQMGHLGFLAFYLVSGLAAAAAHIAADPGSVVPTVGASGAIGGVLGGYLLLFPRARIDILVIFFVFFRVFALPAWVMLGLWFGMQILGGLGTPSEAGGIAYWAHAGGFAAGMALTLPLWLRRGAAAFWQRTQGRPPHPETQYSPSSIPVIRRRRK